MIQVSEPSRGIPILGTTAVRLWPFKAETSVEAWGFSHRIAVPGCCRVSGFGVWGIRVWVSRLGALGAAGIEFFDPKAAKLANVVAP